MAIPSPVRDADQFVSMWASMWNGSFELAHQICGEYFQIAFGAPDEKRKYPADGLWGPDSFIEFLRQDHLKYPGIRFTIHDPLIGVFDPVGVSNFAARWHADLPGGTSFSGIDAFEAHDGMLRRVWSVSAQRRFPFE